MKYIPFFALLIPTALAGCTASIGDSCDTSNDCPSGLVCDTDSPSGYCLATGCEFDEECPENSVCVAFTDSLRYCLKKCKKDSDCRSKYTCRDDIGPSKFCYVAPEYTYGRDPNNEVDFSISEP